jgi:ABC-type antimicrobial peptide transport system permease subunit
MVFGSQDPIGQRVVLNFSNPAHDAEIVGVVATIRHGGPAATEAPEVYAPAAQTPLPRYTVLLRTNIEPQSLFSAIARVVHRADRDVAVAVPTRWSDAVEARFAVHQVRLALVMALAAIAMLLAGLSAFGTVGEMVNSRTREFAVRIALGAAPSSLVGTVVADVGAYVAAALAVGMSLIPVLRVLAASTMDGVVLPRGWPELAALALVTAVVAAATWLPTRQVERVDPASILRA